MLSNFLTQKENRKIDHRKMKRSIIYDQKSMNGLKNWFFKTDQSIMIENQFLIGITGGCYFEKERSKNEDISGDSE